MKVTALAVLVAGISLASGLHGTVTRGPITPVCRVNVPCYAPAKEIPLSFVLGVHTYTTKTNSLGRYRIALPPGTYTVLIAKKYGMSYRPRTVSVPKGLFALSNIAIDTGIR